MDIYAVVKTGGKQYRISPGDVLQVEKLLARPGDVVEISDVFMLVAGDDVTLGNPTVADARVIAEVVGEGRGEKLRIFKKRRRKHYQKTMGHRQHYSAIRIAEIIQGDKTYKTNDVDARDVGVRKSGAKPPAPIAPMPGRQNKFTGEKSAPSWQTGAPPTFTSSDRIEPPPTFPDVDTVTETPQPSAKGPVPASAEIGETAPTVFPDDNGELALRDILDVKPEESRKAPIHDMRAAPAVPPSSVNPIPVSVAEVAMEGVQQPLTAESTSATITGAPKEAKSSRVGLVWSLVALLALLFGAIGWLFKADKKPSDVSARIDAQTEQATLRQIKEAKVHKPARASAPSAPTQPPD